MTQNSHNKLVSNKYFYKHTPLRSIEEVKEDLLALEEKAEEFLNEILNF